MRFRRRRSFGFRGRRVFRGRRRVAVRRMRRGRRFGGRALRIGYRM